MKALGKLYTLKLVSQSELVRNEAYHAQQPYVLVLATELQGGLLYQWAFWSNEKDLDLESSSPLVHWGGIPRPPADTQSCVLNPIYTVFFQSFATMIKFILCIRQCKRLITVTNNKTI